MEKINCSVGILTFNSERTLRRALESVKDFDQVIVSDGGSTDSTLDIAREYNCTIVDQYTKHHPGPDQYHPIEDFSRERNLMLRYSRNDWFLWIDSDEYISEKLHEEIKLITRQSEPSFYAYEVPIAVQSHDGTKTYKRPQQIYQIRFFNLKTGGAYERAMHERFVFDRTAYSTGRLEGVWYVPLSKPDFTSYGRAVRYRLLVMYQELLRGTFFEFMRYGIFIPVKRFLGIVVRFVHAKFRYRQESMPFFYYRNQAYSQWVTFLIVLKLYRTNLRKRIFDGKNHD
jgi:glycosyltransferase involved in cell wall biosynthesis